MVRKKGRNSPSYSKISVILNSNGAKIISAIVILFLLLGVIDLLDISTQITGSVAIEKSYSLNLSKELTAIDHTTTEIPISFTAPPTSLKLDGKLVGNGTAIVYLEINQQRYLILNTSQFSTEDAYPLLTITGRLIETTATNASNETGINETTAEINKTIDVLLEYQSGTPFDSDDDGIETTQGAIDYTVANTQFSWPVDESNLCTRWKVDTEVESTVICNGAQLCCSLTELTATDLTWNEPFYLAYRAYNTSSSNRVNAQVIYANYSLDLAESDVDVAYSEWQSLQALFLKIVEFQNQCAQTCSLPKLNNTQAKLIVELESATLTLNTLTYNSITDVNTPPKYNTIPPQQVKVNSALTLNLSQYFYDSDGDTLTYTASSDTEDVTVSIASVELAVIEPRTDFIGSATLTFTANDSQLTAQTTTTVKVYSDTINTPPILIKEISNISLQKTKEDKKQQEKLKKEISSKLSIELTKKKKELERNEIKIRETLQNEFENKLTQRLNKEKAIRNKIKQEIDKKEQELKHKEKTLRENIEKEFKIELVQKAKKEEKKLQEKLKKDIESRLTIELHNKEKELKAKELKIQQSLENEFEHKLTQKIKEEERIIRKDLNKKFRSLLKF